MRIVAAGRLFFFCLALALAGCRGQAPPAPGQPENGAAEREISPPSAGPADYPRLLSETRRTAREMETLLPLRQALEMFNAFEGRYPGSLEEMVEKGYYEAIPEPPPGTRYDYRPASGQLELAPAEG